MIRQRHFIAVVGAFLMGCAVLLLAVRCAGVRSQAPQKEEQGHTEATTEQTHSSGAASSEEARCRKTRTFHTGRVTTNDVPGRAKGGLLCGTDGRDQLYGKYGDDEIHGLGGDDAISGGDGNDVIYGGDAGDNDKFGGGGLSGDEGEDVLYGGDGNDDMGGGEGEDVLYGGDGNDWLFARDKQRDKLYCGEGSDAYMTDKIDYVDSSCEDPFVT